MPDPDRIRRPFAVLSAAERQRDAACGALCWDNGALSQTSPRDEPAVSPYLLEAGFAVEPEAEDVRAQHG